MNNKRNNLEQLFLQLVATRSDTNSNFEAIIEEIILSWIKNLEYFKRNPANVGTKSLFNDPYCRNVVWALVKGKGSKTIVLINHHDAVDIEEYGSLKQFALRPDELKIHLSTKKLSETVRKDLDSGEWIFGRGTADMKAGTAIQLSLIGEYSELDDFDGNLLFLSVPDEESFSKGMLSAVELMAELKTNYLLDYILTINSEPYRNNKKNQAIMHQGSVGKIMPIVYVKGVKSHIGDPYSGMNPSIILAHIQRQTELNVDLCDHVNDEATPPPVWVNFRSNKKSYDASIPESAMGYFNWLTFTTSPVEILNKMNEISHKALETTIFHFNESYEQYRKMNDLPPDKIEFSPRVLDFKTLYQEAMLKGGKDFVKSYGRFEYKINEKLIDNEISQPEAAIRLLEFTADYVDLEGPAVVIAISGPYYPSISNYLMKNGKKYDLHRRVNEIAQKRYRVKYTSREYFMGISDLSYASWVGTNLTIEAIKENSPGWDRIYQIPFWAIQSLSSPVVNIGPWGKDLHKVTERVYAKDIFERVPEIISELIKQVFEVEKEQTCSIID